MTAIPIKIESEKPGPCVFAGMFLVKISTFALFIVAYQEVQTAKIFIFSI